MTMLNPLYVAGPDLQMFFIDKTTAEPLSGGIVTFYSDSGFTVLKNVYQLDNSSPTGFSVLNNPITLTSVGTFADNNGNDIIPYFYPYDDFGEYQPYFITVYSSGGVLQFTRMEWPPDMYNGENTINTNELINYIPNGQFLLHNNFPTTSMSGANTITNIAPGGWTFVKPTSTSSVDTISFIREVSTSNNPDETANPRYMFQLNTSVIAGDANKDLTLTFPDVNKFAGDHTVAANTYTYSFQGNSTTSNPVIVELILNKYFGVGGSAYTPQALGTITINPGYSVYNFQFQFGSNEGLNVGAADTDYVQLILRFPNSLQTVQLSDFVLANTDQDIVAFPQTTNATFIENSTIGWLPTPNQNGFDLYLPLMLTDTGTVPDYSQTGTIVAKLTTTAAPNELLCNGQYVQTSSYSSSGIPYARLQAILFDSTTLVPLFGTGLHWVNVYGSSGADQMIFTTNMIGAAQTVPADGVTATGFTFTAAYNIGTGGYNYKAYSNTVGYVTAISTFTTGTSSNNGVGAGTSGMSVYNYVSNNVSSTFFVFNVQALSAATLSAGSGNQGLYFTFSNHSTNYAMWFSVAGEIAPTVSGSPTLIQCNLTSTMTAQDVGSIIAATLTGYQTNFISVSAQPTGGAGSYFTFYSNSIKTAVWYQIDGAGSAPSGISSLVQVSILSTDNAPTINAKTRTAINSAFYAVPNLQGAFLRGNDPSSIWDLDVNTRFSPDSYLNGTNVGSMELSQVISHQHPVNSSATGGSSTQGGTTGSSETGLYGGTENRPVNMSVNYFIKF